MTHWATRSIRHIRRLWPGAGILLPLPFVGWALLCLAIGQWRWEHLVFLLVAPALAYTSAATKRLFLGLLPMVFLGLVYDAMRWVSSVGVTQDRVHLCDLRALDMRIAGAMVDGQRGSVHDWVQAHPSRIFDLVCAVPYGTFLFVAVGFAIYLYAKDYARMQLFGWGFLAVNVAGFATYHLYPAAAPWYFHAHGCTVDLTTHAYEGANLARVDAFLGIHYFHDFYGRASDVFGAVPSLHVSYPTLILLFGWPALRWPGRVFACVFLLWMSTAAVYLDHHWIIDVVLGVAYTVVVYSAVIAIARARSPRTRQHPEGSMAAEAVP